MKHEKEHINRLEPLLKWLIGDATRHDERALDASAKGDPFLADALEGYRTMPEADHAADVTRLKARLRKQSEGRRGAGFYLLRIAAVGVVLVAAWVVLQQFQSSDKSAPVADLASTEVQSAPIEPASASADSVVGSIAQQENTEGVSADERVAFQPEVSAKRKKDGPQARTNTNDQSFNNSKDAGVAATESAAPPPVTLMESRPEPVLEADDEVAFEEKKPAADLAKAKTSAPEARKRADNAPATSNPIAPASSLRKITGKVTDGTGQPLIGVSILAKGTGTGTVTDIDGGYSLDVPQTAAALDFTYTGYSPMEVIFGEKTTIDVTLAESDVALSEVVVTGYSQSSGAPAPLESPRPAGGFNAFKQYVADNLRHPEVDQQPLPREVVRVRFTLQANGKLTNFNPRGDAPQAYKDEAIRLLREGPIWNGTPNTTATYRFVFE